MSSFEGYEAYWSEQDNTIKFYFEDTQTIILKIDEDLEGFHCAYHEDESGNIPLIANPSAANTALILFGVIQEWQNLELPSYPGYDGNKGIILFLSQTGVQLTDQEKDTIVGILKRMAKSKGYDYKNDLHNISFEVELRALVGDKEQVQTEDSSEDDLDEWI